jgi:hypothetical protein
MAAWRKSGIVEKTLCKWDIYVPLVTKGLSVEWYDNDDIWTSIGKENFRTYLKLLPLFSFIITAWNYQKHVYVTSTAAETEVHRLHLEF